MIAFSTFEPTCTQRERFETSEYGGNRCAVFRIEGNLDIDRLRGAIRTVVAHCPPLSYRVLRVDGAPRILVDEEPRADLCVMESSADDAALFAMIETLCNRHFRLDGGAPYLFCLLHGKTTQYFAFICHPAVIDRFSMRPLFAALSTAYRGAPLPPSIGLSQDELCAAEMRRLEAETYPESLRFWKQLAGGDSLEWRPGRMEENVTDQYFSTACRPETHAALTRLAEELAIGLDHLLLFAFHLFLYRVTRDETVLTTYRHRIRTGRHDEIGFNQNQLFFKSLLSPRQTVATFLRQAERLFAQVNHHADIPSGSIMDELRRQDPSYRPSNVLFDEDTLPYRELSLEGTQITLLPRFSHRLETQDLAIYFDVQDPVTFHGLTRSPQDTPGVQEMFAHYLTLLDHLPNHLDTPIEAVPMHTEAQHHHALHLADGGPLLAPATDVLTLFVAACERHPDAPAVRFGDAVLTYDQLSLSAGSIAARVAPAVAGKQDPLIGLCLERSQRMMQSILGVLAAGAGYLPLDPKLPDERMRFIAEDANLTAVIADAETRDQMASVVNCPVWAVEDLLEQPVRLTAPPDQAETAQRTAYVIYTSGTTGKPKGVVIERRMLAHLVAALDGVWDRGPGARWMQFASISFDASVLEIFNPLTHGGELVVVPTELRADPEALFELLREQRITHAFLPPALLRLLPRRPLPDLQSIFCGGEASDEDTARFWSKRVGLANIYGPTETTVMATINWMGGYKSASHLGRPLRGYNTYLLDDSGELAPIGGVGEICIGGPGVARGYLGRPELSAQKFLPAPHGTGRIYRTGDLGRFLPNGGLEFLGRNDFQVKIRGFRIELGDIEAAIADQPEVEAHYVGAFDYRGGKQLMVWYVAHNLTPDELRTRLDKRLQPYMVPAFLIPIDAFPLNISGKIDRSRLPMPDPHPATAAEQPLDKLAVQIRDIWADVLGVPPMTLGTDSHFFHLGGHSLMVVLVCSKLSEALGNTIRSKQLFEHPLLGDFCEQVRGAPPTDHPFPPLSEQGAESAPIVNRLIGMIHSRAMHLPDDNTYNILVRIDFTPDINPLKLRQSAQELLDAHPVFRAAFEEHENRLWIKAQDIHVSALPLVDHAEPEAIDNRAEAMRAEVLHIGQAPLWRAEIHCSQVGGTTLLFCVHHAIFDGWSLNLFLEELADRYEGRTPAPRLSWLDYCQWAQVLPKSTPFAESIDYWKTKLAGADAHTELPVDFRRQEQNANQSLPVRFAPDTVAALQAFADEQEITLSPLMFSLYLVWIWRLTGQEELVCGYPYAGRDVPGSENVFGMFVTMGFLRQTLHPQRSFQELAQAVHHQMLDDKDHLLATPYDAEIAGLESLNLIFSLQSGIGLEGTLGGAQFRADELPSPTSKADLTGVFYQTADGAIEGRIEFDASRFQPDTVRGFLDTFQALVQAAARAPSTRIFDLEYQSETALARFLDHACGPRYEQAATHVPARFAASAKAHADQTALVFGEKRHTYQELEEWVERIAAGLAPHVQPGERLGLSMEKSDGLVATVLALFRLGCAYVPLDPAYPPERVRFFVENAQVRQVVADTPGHTALTKMGLTQLNYIDPLMDPGEAPPAPPCPVVPETLAYIIHTSGSTGKPKGVMIEHRTVVQLADAAGEAIDLGPGSVSSLVASMNFDASVLEIFPCLLAGHTLVVIPETTRTDPAALHEALDQHGVTHAILSPVMLQNLPHKPLPSLQMLGFGGDVIDEPTAAWWSHHTRFFSLYGPTETTVMASCGQILPGANSRVIGKPLAGYRLYLLNQYRQPVPAGTVGEICIGGDVHARGYLNREDLSVDRFVLDPYGGSPYALMYLTGDLGRFQPDGTIEFFGRNDAQIKLRGFRIELGEIENCLATAPGVQQVVCDAKGEGENRYLAAYYVADHELDDDELRHHASGFLPDYMVPSFFVRLDRLPVSPSGKIDRKQLPALSGKVSENPPHDGLERQIADIWEEILRYRGIGRDDSFFHVGGNSLLAVRMQAQVNARLGLEFGISEFYGAPTIAALASGRTFDPIQEAVADAHAEITLGHATPPEHADTGPASSVLLTGAAGFLGIYLLEELLKRAEAVHCLVRGDDRDAGLARLKAAAAQAGLAPDFNRVRVVSGDLTQPRLGLADEQYERLAQETDAIVHCGSRVHHLQAYAGLKDANVNGTEALLALALTGRRKPFTYISTITVATALADIDRGMEAVLPNPPAISNGYVLTKWVSEQRAARYAERYGLPMLIARAGNITGSTATGYSNYANNHFWLFNKGCLQLGAYPDMEQPVEMTPVDVLARILAQLACTHTETLRVANLCNPHMLTQREFFDLLAQHGHYADALSVPEWQARLAEIDESNALAQLKDFYTGDISGAPVPIEQCQTLVALDAQGIAMPDDYPQWVEVYVRYLEQEGFLEHT